MRCNPRIFRPNKKGQYVKIKLRTILGVLFVIGMIISACSPTGAEPAAPADVAAADTASSEPEAAATEIPVAIETLEPTNLVIAPETLGQLRFFWNAEFPGEVSASDTNVGCSPALEPCPLQTNITDYAFSPDGNTLAVGVCEGTTTQDRSKEDSDFYSCSGGSAIILYDSITGEERGRLAPAALPLSLAFHPDGSILAAGLANSDIELWDLLNGEVSNTLSGTPRFVGINSLAFTPDGNLLIYDFVFTFRLSLWDWRSSEPPILIDRARGVGISPDSHSLVTTNFGTQAGDEADAIRIYDLAQLDQFSEIPLDGQLPPYYFSFNPRNGWISGTEADFPAVTNFWNPSTLDLVGSLDWDQEFDETGMLYDLNSGGFTPDGYFVLNRSGELLAPEAQPEATGLDEILWECGFALADMESNQIFFTSHPMIYDECIGPENMYIIGGSEPLILSPDGRFIAGEDGLGSLRLWGIDASLPAVEPTCYGDC